MNFISNNNFTIANNDLTKEFQRDLRNIINKCQSYKKTKEGNTLILILPPTIRGLIKVHKEDSPH